MYWLEITTQVYMQLVIQDSFPWIHEIRIFFIYSHNPDLAAINKYNGKWKEGKMMLGEIKIKKKMLSLLHCTLCPGLRILYYVLPLFRPNTHFLHFLLPFTMQWKKSFESKYKSKKMKKKLHPSTILSISTHSSLYTPFQIFVFVLWGIK